MSADTLARFRRHKLIRREVYLTSSGYMVVVETRKDPTTHLTLKGTFSPGVDLTDEELGTITATLVLE